MLALKLAIELVLLIAVGFLVWRLKLVDESFDKSITAFLLNIALPCLIVHSFNAEYSADRLRDCVILLGLSLALMVLWFIIGEALFLLHGKSYTGRALRFGAMFTNFSFVGFPVAQALYGQTGLLYFVVFSMPIRIVYYSSAKWLLSPPEAAREKQSVKQHLKNFFAPPVVAVFLGLIVYLTGFKFPEPIDMTISSIGAVASPMGMILCGITIGKSSARSLLKLRYLRMPLLRNMLMPAVTTLAMLFLPVSPAVAKIVVIYAALPVASLLTAFTIQYDTSPEARLEAAGSVFFSVLFCAFTIPLWAQVAELLF